MMKNDAHKKVNHDEISSLLDAIFQGLPIPPKGLGLPQYTPLPVIVITVTAAPADRSEDDEDDFDQTEFDEDSFNEDDWDDEDGCECEYLDAPQACPAYEPVSKKVGRCLFLCPCCGDCLRQHIAEDLA